MTDQPKRQFEIIKLYLKDVSFESPGAPNSFQDQGQPKVNLEMDHTISEVAEGVYEVALRVGVKTSSEESDIFLVELIQGGLFHVVGFEQQEMDQMLNTFCVATLFPYAREAVSDLCVKGGFQPLLLAPVNFDVLYQQRLAQAKAEAEGQTAQ